jgi:hypothetical protein
MKSEMRAGPLDGAKVFESCYAACLSCGLAYDEAEEVSSELAARLRARARKGRLERGGILRQVVRELEDMERPALARAYLDVW